MKHDEAKEVVRALWKQGHKEEARALFKIATGMNSETQELQNHFFQKALSTMGVDSSSLSLDPQKRIMSFDVSGMDPFVELPRFVERFLRSLNRVGNTSYKLARLRRQGSSSAVEIKIGR